MEDWESLIGGDQHDGSYARTATSDSPELPQWSSSCPEITKNSEDGLSSNFAAIKQKIMFTDDLIKINQDLKCQLDEMTRKHAQATKSKELVQSQLELLLSKEQPSFSDGERLNKKIGELEKTVEELNGQLYAMDESRKLHEESIKALRAEENVFTAELKKKHLLQITELKKDLSSKNDENKKLKKKNRKLLNRIESLEKKKSSPLPVVPDLDIVDTLSEMPNTALENSTDKDSSQKVTEEPSLDVESANDCEPAKDQKREDQEHEKVQESHNEDEQIRSATIKSATENIDVEGAPKKDSENRLSKFQSHPSEEEVSGLNDIARHWKSLFSRKTVRSKKKDKLQSLYDVISKFSQKHGLEGHDVVVINKVYDLYWNLFRTNERAQRWFLEAIAEVKDANDDTVHENTNEEDNGAKHKPNQPVNEKSETSQSGETSNDETFVSVMPDVTSFEKVNRTAPNRSINDKSETRQNDDNSDSSNKNFISVMSNIEVSKSTQNQSVTDKSETSQNDDNSDYTNESSVSVMSGVTGPNHPTTDKSGARLSDDNSDFANENSVSVMSDIEVSTSKQNPLLDCKSETTQNDDSSNSADKNFVSVMPDITGFDEVSRTGPNQPGNDKSATRQNDDTFDSSKETFVSVMPDVAGINHTKLSSYVNDKLETSQNHDSLDSGSETFVSKMPNIAGTSNASETMPTGPTLKNAADPQLSELSTEEAITTPSPKKRGTEFPTILNESDVIKSSSSKRQSENVKLSETPKKKRKVHYSSSDSSSRRRTRSMTASSSSDWEDILPKQQHKKRTSRIKSSDSSRVSEISDTGEGNKEACNKQITPIQIGNSCNESTKVKRTKDFQFDQISNNSIENIHVNSTLAQDMHLSDSEDDEPAATATISSEDNHRSSRKDAVVNQPQNPVVLLESCDVAEVDIQSNTRNARKTRVAKIHDNKKSKRNEFSWDEILEKSRNELEIEEKRRKIDRNKVDQPNKPKTSDPNAQKAINAADFNPKKFSVKNKARTGVHLKKKGVDSLGKSKVLPSQDDSSMENMNLMKIFTEMLVTVSKISPIHSPPTIPENKNGVTEASESKADSAKEQQADLGDPQESDESKARSSISPSTVLCTAICFNTPNKENRVEESKKEIPLVKQKIEQTKIKMKPLSEENWDSKSTVARKAFSKQEKEIFRPRRFSCEAPERAVNVPPIKPSSQRSLTEIKSPVLKKSDDDDGNTFRFPQYRKETDIPSHWHSNVALLDATPPGTDDHSDEAGIASKDDPVVSKESDGATTEESSQSDVDSVILNSTVDGSQGEYLQNMESVIEKTDTELSSVKTPGENQINFESNCPVIASSNYHDISKTSESNTSEDVTCQDATLENIVMSSSAEDRDLVLVTDDEEEEANVEAINNETTTDMESNSACEEFLQQAKDERVQLPATATSAELESGDSDAVNLPKTSFSQERILSRNVKVTLKQIDSNADSVKKITSQGSAASSGNKHYIDSEEDCDEEGVLTNFNDLRNLMSKKRKNKNLMKIDISYVMNGIVDILDHTSLDVEVFHSRKSDCELTASDLPLCEKKFLKRIRVLQLSGVVDGKEIVNTIIPFFMKTLKKIFNKKLIAKGMENPPPTNDPILMTLWTYWSPSFKTPMDIERTCALLRVFFFLCKMARVCRPIFEMCRYLILAKKSLVLIISGIEGLLCWPTVLLEHPGFGRILLNGLAKESTSSLVIGDAKQRNAARSKCNWLFKRCGWPLYSSRKAVHMSVLEEAMKAFSSAKLSTNLLAVDNEVEERLDPISIFDDHIHLYVHSLELFTKELVMDVMKKDVLHGKFWPVLEVWAQHIHYNGDVDKNRKVSNDTMIAVLLSFCHIVSYYLLKQKREHKDQVTLPKLQENFDTICHLLRNLSTVYLNKAPKIVRCAAAAFIFSTGFCNPIAAHATLLEWAKSTVEDSTASRSRHIHSDLPITMAIMRCDELTLRRTCDWLDSRWPPGDRKESLLKILFRE